MSKKTMNVLYKSGRKVVVRGSFFLTILLASVVIISGTRAMPLSTEGYQAISYDYAAGLIGFHYEDRFLVGQKTSVEILTNAETEKVTGELYGIYITNGVINYFGEDWYISPRGNIYGSPPTLPPPKMSPLQKATLAAETLFLASVLLPALEACPPCTVLLAWAEDFYVAMLGLLADPVDPSYTTLATPDTPPSITPPLYHKQRQVRSPLGRTSHRHFPKLPFFQMLFLHH